MAHDSSHAWEGGNFDDAYEMGWEHGFAEGCLEALERVLRLLEKELPTTGLIDEIKNMYIKAKEDVATDDAAMAEWDDE